MIPTSVFGHPNERTGLGIAARATADAIGCRFRPVNWLWKKNYKVATRSVVVQFSALGAHGRSWLEREKERGTKVIGYWVFESTKPFDEQLWEAEYYSEIWTPSTFCQRNFRQHGIESMHFPHPMHPQKQRKVGKVRNFTVIFNGDSGENRKHPAAALLAFARAFKPGDGCSLTLKGINASYNLCCCVDYVKKNTGLDVRMINEEFDDHSMEQLWASTDCLVSLHKSEGFGLHIAEAMMRGIPTITTDYSGSQDLKPYGYLPVEWTRIDCDDIATMGGTWASPSMDHAAEQMRSAYDRAPTIDVAGLQKFLSPARIGQSMRKQLQSKNVRRPLPTVS